MLPLLNLNNDGLKDRKHSYASVAVLRYPFSWRFEYIFAVIYGEKV